MDKYLKTDEKNVTRCGWGAADPLYVRYHDREWGMPTRNDQKLFEKICLEGFQSGLSWITILRKRENFREAFAGFEIEKVARFTDRRVEKLLTNAGIIRHRGKIEATVNNAKQALKIQKEFGSLAGFFWQFEPTRQLRFDSSRAITEESTELSKVLRKRGWKFVGPTTCYSFMQAMGFVNDHHPKCFRFSKVAEKRESFKRPKIKHG